MAHTIAARAGADATLREIVKLPLMLAAAAAAAGCVMPPSPRTIPASGAEGQARTSMTSPRKKGENPFRDVYFAVAPESINPPA